MECPCNCYITLYLRERERQTERDRETERQRDRERQREREREREREGGGEGERAVHSFFHVFLKRSDLALLNLLFISFSLLDLVPAVFRYILFAFFLF